MFALDFFVTDVAMVLFFGLVMKEVVEATAHGGALHRGGGRRCRWWRRWIGAVPAILMHPLALFFGEPLVAQGWTTTFAVDLAFAYFMPS